MTDGTDAASPPAADSGGASRYVDTEGVYDYLLDRLGRPSEWALSPHDAGLGNETLFLVWGRRQFVLRRPPLSDATADAHDVFREYRLLSALDRTDVPTPRPVAACSDPSVAGAPFTVQQRADGDVLRHGEPAAYATADYRDRLGTALVETLAILHALDPAEIGLDADDYRRTPADLVATWRDRFEDWRAATDRPVPGADEVADWLGATAPAPDELAVVHGDFTLGNVLYSRATPPEVVGILDWERGGVGDPLTDLGRLLALWTDDSGETLLPHAVVPQFTGRPGFPSRATLRDRYEDVTGRTFDHDRFYRTLAVYEMAAVCESYYLRHLRDASNRPSFAKLETVIPALVDRARAIIDGERPL